jgi:hypothetical protein
LTALLVAVVPQERATAQPKDYKLDPAAIDAMVYTTLRDVIQRGAPIYNAGDFDSCYHLYEGALIAVKPMLAHRFSLQQEVGKALIVAERTSEVQKRAWVLREAMDLVRSETKGKNEGPGPGVPTGTMRGKITVDGQPLMAGKVILWGDQNRFRSGMIDKGMYLVDKIPLGEYRVAIIEDDKLVGKISPEYLDAKTTPLKAVIAEPTPLTADIPLKGAAKIEGPKTLGAVRGKVTVDGKPYQKSAVEFVPVEGKRHLVPVTEDGTYTAEKMIPGNYKVVIHPAEKGPKIDAALQDARTTKLTVDVAAEKATLFDIPLKSVEKQTPPEPKGNGSVQGKLTFDGKPVSGVVVRFISPENKRYPAPTNDEGAYQVGQLPAGTYKVTIEPPPVGGPKIAAALQDVKTTSLTIEIPPDKTTTFDITLKSGNGEKEKEKESPMPESLREEPSEARALAPASATVMGKVTLQGKPLPSGKILFVKDKLSFSAAIDEDGAYLLAKVPVGEYRVAIQSPDRQGKERLPQRYSDAEKSGLIVEIVGPKDVRDFDLN